MAGRAPAGGQGQCMMSMISWQLILIIAAGSTKHLAQQHKQ